MKHQPSTNPADRQFDPRSTWMVAELVQAGKADFWKMIKVGSMA
jgi:hypothetical protein